MNVTRNNKVNIKSNNPTLPSLEGKEQVRLFLEEVPVDATNAKSFSEGVKNYLEENGFDLDLEVRVPDRGDGMAGRVDVVARNKDITIALELDRHTPRDKSVFKLNQVEADYRVVILRDPLSIRFVEDIYQGQPAKLDLKDESVPRLNSYWKERIGAKDGTWLEMGKWASRLLEETGLSENQVMRQIDLVAAYSEQKYFPVVGSFKDLANKQSGLKAFFARMQEEEEPEKEEEIGVIHTMRGKLYQ